jgi:hypothetical protein
VRFVVVIQKPDGTHRSRWAQVHVPLGGSEIDVPGQFLDRPGGGAAHGQVGTEGVTEDVNSGLG